MTIEEICQELDKTLLEYLNLINLYQNRRKRTSFLINNGFLELAHSKYVMGPSKISKYQYDRRMQATTRVNISPSKDANNNQLEQDEAEQENFSNYNFTLLEGVQPEKVDIQPDSPSGDFNTSSPTGFRQRSKLPTPIGSKTIQDEEIEEEVKQAEVNNDKYLKGNVNGAPIPLSTFTSSAPTRIDPVNWFGVLVPSSLRNSQANFQQFLLESMGLINLKSQILALENRIETLKLQKSKHLH